MAAKAKSPPQKKRVREMPRHRSFRLTRGRIKNPKPMPGFIWLFRQTFSLIRSHKRLFLGITLVHAVLTFVFVQGLGSTFDLAEVKSEIEELFGEQASRATTAVTLFGYLIGSASSQASDIAGAYQMFFMLITSLAVIWAVRQVQASVRVSVKDSFYKGIYPLVPFLLILVVIGLQFIPFLLGNLIYSTVIANGLAVLTIEKIVWLLFFGLLALLSAYMVTSSIFALYIVTLPEMTPMKALRSAREIVLHRRLSVGIRILILPIVLGVLTAIVFIPLIILAAGLVQPLFLLALSFGLVISHIYMYSLYRSLL